MTRNRFRLAAALAGLTAITGCAASPEPGTGNFAMQVSALSGTCGSVSTNSPLGEIRSFKLIVRKPDANGVMQPYPKFTPITASFNGSSKSITFSGVPADSPLEVTLLGYTQSSTPSWFARKSALTVNKLETEVVDVTLMASEGFTCVQPDAGLYKLAFPVATKIAGDKILLTGGFSNFEPDGADFKLDGPVSQAWLFDPAKGTFTDAGQLLAPRGGHSAIYLPKSGEILISGGVNKMAVKADGSAPPSWNPADAVNPRWEVCTLDANNQLSCSTDATIQDNVIPRVMPNLLLLTADYVVASGGAPWPTTDSLDYRCADLYDPTLVSQVADGTGGFTKLLPGALCMNGSRAGAAIAPFAQPTAAGTLHYLIWGGNQEIVPAGSPTTPAGKVVEEAYESSELGDVKFNDDWQLLGTDGNPTTDYTETNGSLFFPTLSSLGAATIDPGDGSPVQNVERFAAIGGARWKTGVWAPPSPDDAFLLTVNSAQKTIVVQKMPGLTDGVYFASATATGGHVVVGGGLVGLKAGAATLTDFAPNPDDPYGPLIVGANPPDAAATFVARGALAGQKLSNDCILMFGGVTDFADLTSPNNGGGASDVYCPGFLAQ